MLGCKFDINRLQVANNAYSVFNSMGIKGEYESKMFLRLFVDLLRSFLVVGN
jgi:hypothetical protein